ncbi:VOC family protein [Micromonospora sp. BRA006-A]|nr:VOC family protein [Micromonospora sp. BRA006-A]
MITIPVTDQDKAKDFYARLGFEVINDHEMTPDEMPPEPGLRWLQLGTREARPQWFSPPGAWAASAPERSTSRWRARTSRACTTSWPRRAWRRRRSSTPRSARSSLWRTRTATA